MKKKIISALMAMAMCVSAVPTVANADVNSFYMNSFGSFDYFICQPYPNYFESDEFKEDEARKYDLPYNRFWAPIHSYTGHDDVEYLEFAQRIRDECMLNPEESELNRIIDNYAKEIYDNWEERWSSYGEYSSLCDNYVGVAKCHNHYEVYGITDYSDVEIRLPDREVSWDVESLCFPQYSEGQSVDVIFSIEKLLYKDNPYITEEDFYALSLEEQIVKIMSIYEETGKVIAHPIRASSDEHETGEIHGAYCSTDGKGYIIKDVYEYDDDFYTNGFGYVTNHYKKYIELNIVNGKVVSIPDISLDNLDILNSEYLKGDANEDGDVDIADAVFIMQSLSNPDEYKLSEQGRLNADYNGDGGVTALDALEIQMMTIS